MIFRTRTDLYNTKTAKLLVSRSSLRFPWESLSYFEADLCKTKGDKFFLYGKGGVLSIFRGKEEDVILPLNFGEAKRIAKAYMKPNDYQKEFGE